MTPEDAQASVKTLTRRQREVLSLTAKGFPRVEIAALLGLSQKTIDSHSGALVKKLDVSSLYEACAVAGAAGIA